MLLKQRVYWLELFVAQSKENTTFLLDLLFLSAHIEWTVWNSSLNLAKGVLD